MVSYSLSSSKRHLIRRENIMILACKVNQPTYTYTTVKSALLFSSSPALFRSPLPRKRRLPCWINILQKNKTFSIFTCTYVQHSSMPCCYNQADVVTSSPQLVQPAVSLAVPFSTPISVSSHEAFGVFAVTSFVVPRNFRKSC